MNLITFKCFLFEVIFVLAGIENLNFSYLFDSKLESRFLLCILMATIPYRIKKHAHGMA